ncbi:hypothetical protein QZH41_019740 [Actinostola sp. cb2023]|nr:hypothetical protein QZH41_019740 [Actinostola sp. cb2023]
MSGKPTVRSYGHDQLLKDFLNLDEPVDKLYKHLDSTRCLGRWDFERVARKYKLKEEDLLAIKSLIHVENGSPSKVLCDKLCIEVRPPITVRDFANTLKDINKKAYEILVPHFTKPAPGVDIIDETAC